MTTEMIVYFALGAFAGGFVNGLAGTATAFFALGFFLHAVSSTQAVAMVALLAALSGLQGLWEVRDTIKENKSGLMRFILPGIIGVPVGTAVLAYIDAQSLRMFIAVMLIVYGGYYAFQGNTKKTIKANPKIDAIVGFMGGFMGGATSLSGVIPSIWLTVTPLSKEVMRAFLQGFNFTILTMTIVVLATKGAYDATIIKAFFFVVLPIGFVAAQIGIFVFRKLSDEAFRRLLVGSCLLLGAALIVRELI